MARYNFALGISDWCNETKQEVAASAAQVARTVFTMIVDRSPYLTGRFIGSWIVGPTDANYSSTVKMTWDEKIAEIRNTIPDDYFLKHDKVYLVNNLSYTSNVEYTGWAKTIAYAPVAKTLTKIGNGFAPVGQTLGMIAGGIV